MPSELETNQAMSEVALGFRPPRTGELYVNTGNDRVCIVEGDDGQRYTGNQRWRRVRIRYVDTGVRTKVHLYRWDLSSVPVGAFPRCPRMLRVCVGVRVTNLKRTILEQRTGKPVRYPNVACVGEHQPKRWMAYESHIREAFSGLPPSGLYHLYRQDGAFVLERTTRAQKK